MKILIYGGHVIDPANRVNSKLNLLVEDGRIVWIGTEMPDADHRIDATGKLVTPGFIDIHMHEDPVQDEKIQQDIFLMMLRMGVTTAVGGNCGINVYDPGAYLNIVDKDGAAVNVALFAGHEYFRKAAGAEDIYAGSTEEQKVRMAENIRTALDQGCVGVSFGLRYVPGANKDEFFRAAACCKEENKLIASHVRDDADGVFGAIEEFAAAGVEYGLPVQISHIGSMGGFGQMEQVLQQIDAYRLNGLDITMDCYPYFAFSTRIGTPTYDPGWLDRYHCGYEVLEFCEGKYKGQQMTLYPVQTTSVDRPVDSTEDQVNDYQPKFVTGRLGAQVMRLIHIDTNYHEDKQRPRDKQNQELEKLLIEKEKELTAIEEVNGLVSVTLPYLPAETK